MLNQRLKDASWDQNIIQQLAFPDNFFTLAPCGWMVAFSGGIDSRVLLDLAFKAHQISGIPVSVIHLNHQINPKAASWAQQCALTAAQLNLPFKLVALPNNLAGPNLEERLRGLRYEAFKVHLPPKWGLLLAHHAGDQAETVLLQLMRGAGVLGLAGMPKSSKPWHQGFSWRPLLDVTRQMITSYATDSHLSWVEDDSNADTRFSRNWVRHQLLPLIIKRQPAAPLNFNRSAECLAQSIELLEEVALNDWNLTQQADLNASTTTVDFRALEGLSEAHIFNFWRFFWRHLSLPMPSKNWLSLFWRTITQAKDDAKVSFTLAQLTIKRYQHKVYFLAHGAAFKCDAAGRITFPDERKFSLTMPLDGGYWRTLALNATVLRADGAARTWGKWAQNLKIPPWWRTNIPTWWRQESLVMVPGFWAAKGYSYQEVN